MALVTFQANGLYSVFQERQHVSKPFSNGQYAFAGVSAALMSAAGLTGSDDIVGGRDGLLDAWGVTNGAQLVTRGLGTDYAIMQTLYDAFPEERQTLYDLYRGAFAQNVSLATGNVVLDLGQEP